MRAIGLHNIHIILYFGAPFSMANGEEAAAGRHHEHEQKSRHHFLVVAYGIQSHVNPGRALAHCLTRLGDGSIVATLAVSVATHRRMFPSPAGGAEETTDGGGVSYVPFSDGFDDGSAPKTLEDWERSGRASARSLSALVARFAAAGRPVTCIVCTLVLPGVLDAARDCGVPLAVYWIQPATVLATYYHYFHGCRDLIDTAARARYDDDSAAHEVGVSLPGLRRPLRARDLPSYLADTGTDKAEITNKFFRDLYEYMEQWRTRVLVNTSHDLEPAALAEMERHLDVFAVGPMVGSSAEAPAPARIHLFKHDDVDRTRYMEWLGARRERSVVYVSFGSITKCTKRQMDEVLRGLRRCGRPYLLVLRKDGLEEEDDGENNHGLDLEVTEDDQQPGMVVDWCEQLEVLSQPAVGCFVTHCGWNSTLEAMASGVPTIGVPNIFDQPTNMYLMEAEWMTGVRGERDGEGFLTATELARCIELVMGDGAEAMAMRERAAALKEIAKETAAAGGFAERSLCDFVKTFQSP